ncbi:MAG: type II toxin-antitoxin system VapC family toxin [Solirubrobacterales bacterium]|nr:type II toxin-antitoxin system VapC family toxin [Solirubrobacterales bacterium]
MARGLLDTSILVAFESGRPIATDHLPDETVISPVTLGELHAGVLTAGDYRTRALRMATLDTASDIELVPIDDSVAEAWALLRAHLRACGRTVRVNDLWIAATALAHGMPLYTQDTDFRSLTDVDGLTVIKV